MTAIAPELFDDIVSVRRDLHRHPELSGQEAGTATKVCALLDRLGIAYRGGIAGHGIIAEVPGQRDKPFIALRADMDALPIHEETGLAFASERDGLMHACGHDGHMSMLYGAASLLANGAADRSAQEPTLPLPVRLIFQPAEEIAQGAKAMIEAGALDDVAMIFGGHLDRHYPVGSVVVHEGAVNASSDKFHIEISGEGGHAARPHEAIDAVVVGSLLVMAIQTIVSREVNPQHPSVVTVGRFDAGTASNVIAGRAKLSGSIRAQDADVREHLHRSIRRIAQSVGQLHDAHVEVDIVKGTPVLLNKPPAVDLARWAAAEAVGESNVLDMTVLNMGAEDFSYYLEHVPGCYVRFGAQFEDRPSYPAHSSKFDVDERALAVGAAYYRAVAEIAARAVIEGL